MADVHDHRAMDQFHSARVCIAWRSPRLRCRRVSPIRFSLTGAARDCGAPSERPVRRAAKRKTLFIMLRDRKYRRSRRQVTAPASCVLADWTAPMPVMALGQVAANTCRRRHNCGMNYGRREGIARDRGHAEQGLTVGPTLSFLRRPLVREERWTAHERTPRTRTDRCRPCCIPHRGAGPYADPADRRRRLSARRSDKPRRSRRHRARDTAAPSGETVIRDVMR